MKGDLSLQIARTYIERNYPECLAAFLAGSVVRGENTECSDLDLVIISNNIKSMHKICLIENGWPIEAFIYSPVYFRTFFEGDLLTGNPFLPRMCAEGVIIQGSKAEEIKLEAIERLKGGPPLWTEEQIKHYRYLITDLVDDLKGSTRETENLFIVARLGHLLHEYILRTNKQWTGEGKWVVRALDRFDPDLSKKFTDVFEEYFTDKNQGPLLQFVDEVLHPFGGLLFEGYRT